MTLLDPAQMAKELKDADYTGDDAKRLRREMCEEFVREVAALTIFIDVRVEGGKPWSTPMQEQKLIEAARLLVEAIDA